MYKISRGVKATDRNLVQLSVHDHVHTVYVQSIRPYMYIHISAATKLHKVQTTMV